jgi:hypothetical protein
MFTRIATVEPQRSALLGSWVLSACELGAQIKYQPGRWRL